MQSRHRRGDTVFSPLAVQPDVVSNENRIIAAWGLVAIGGVAVLLALGSAVPEVSWLVERVAGPWFLAAAITGPQLTLASRGVGPVGTRRALGTTVLAFATWLVLEPSLSGRSRALAAVGLYGGVLAVEALAGYRSVDRPLSVPFRK